MKPPSLPSHSLDDSAGLQSQIEEVQHDNRAEATQVSDRQPFPRYVPLTSSERRRHVVATVTNSPSAIPQSFPGVNQKLCSSQTDAVEELTPTLPMPSLSVQARKTSFVLESSTNAVELPKLSMTPTHPPNDAPHAINSSPTKSKHTDYCQFSLGHDAAFSNSNPIAHPEDEVTKPAIEDSHTARIRSCSHQSESFSANSVHMLRTESSLPEPSKLNIQSMELHLIDPVLPDIESSETKSLSPISLVQPTDPLAAHSQQESVTKVAALSELGSADTVLEKAANIPEISGDFQIVNQSSLVASKCVQAMVDGKNDSEHNRDAEVQPSDFRHRPSSSSAIAKETPPAVGSESRDNSNQALSQGSSGSTGEETFVAMTSVQKDRVTSDQGMPNNKERGKGTGNSKSNGKSAPPNQESGDRSSNTQEMPLPDELSRKRRRNYMKIRENLRKAMETKDYARVPFIKKNTALKMQPEPDTLDVLADCLACMEDDEWMRCRKKARTLRNDPAYTEADTVEPVAELARAIGNSSGDYDDFDLITSTDRSKPEFKSSFFKDVRQSDGTTERFLVQTLTIQLDLCPGLVVDGVTEVVAEVSEPCDDVARPEERNRKEARLRQKAASTALDRLKALVARSKEIRDVEHADIVEDQNSPVNQLKNLIANTTGAFELFLSREKSFPGMRTTEEKPGEFKVCVRVLLDSSAWLDLEMPKHVERDANEVLPLRILPEVREKKINAIMNDAAEKVIQDLNEIAEKVVNHAKNVLKDEVRVLLASWATLNKTPLYVRTLDLVKKIVCSEHNAGLYGYKLNCFGSMPCELALPGSDLDVNISLPPRKYLQPVHELDDDEVKGVQEREYPPDVNSRVLAHLEPIMRKFGMKRVHFIGARVPLLRFIDPETEIEVDLTVGNPDGILLTKFLRYHVRVDRRVWGLAMLVRHWAKQRKISGVVNGFINPLGWTVMVVYFLQHGTFPAVAKLFDVVNADTDRVARNTQIHHVRWNSPSQSGTNEWSVEELLVEFFRFYTKEFNFGENVISLNMQRPSKKAEFKAKELKIDCPITIEQPMMRGKNIVGYVSKDSLIATITQMEIALFRAVNVGKVSAVFRITGEPRYEPQ